MADIREVREEQSKLLNQLYKAISETFNYQLQYGIVHLAEKGVSVTWLAEAFGVTPARIYQIIDKFRKEQNE